MTCKIIIVNYTKDSRPGLGTGLNYGGPGSDQNFSARPARPPGPARPAPARKAWWKFFSLWVVLSIRLALSLNQKAQKRNRQVCFYFLFQFIGILMLRITGKTSKRINKGGYIA
jgi:hypothetical protein